MNEPSNLTEIGIGCLANCLLPIVRHHNVHLTELSCLSPRLGNLLLKHLIKYKRSDCSSSTDYFLSLFINPAQKYSK